VRRAGLAAAVAALLLGATGCLSVSVPDYVADHYDPRPSEGTARVFHADESPSRVAHDIADARPPAERRVTPSGVFMRYQKDMVGVVPDPAGGSRILLTSERDGYFLFFPYVGGYWGTYSGRGDEFRGGGPGAGK
jgi:hypothetical protein